MRFSNNSIANDKWKTCLYDGYGRHGQKAQSQRLAMSHTIFQCLPKFSGSVTVSSPSYNTENTRMLLPERCRPVSAMENVRSLYRKWAVAAIHQPIITVVDQPLRRDDLAIALAAVIGNTHLAPLQGGARQNTEPFAGGTQRQTEHADPASRLAEPQSLVREELVNSPRERLKMFGEQPGLEAFKEALEHCQRRQFLRIEPKTGEFVRVAVGASHVPIAAGLLVPLDRCTNTSFMSRIKR